MSKRNIFGNRKQRKFKRGEYIEYLDDIYRVQRMYLSTPEHILYKVTNEIDDSIIRSDYANKMTNEFVNWVN
jgi:hypothetical protein